ncbi:MAG: DUF2207 domain-containing protein [Acidobacteria bacterium]|nr:DUF2207 domain-containing protein [Acidobacteriota bacterium]MBS1865068.1 DUF2207 domain-containing protein [Acidobacteriota bacterium]
MKSLRAMLRIPGISGIRFSRLFFLFAILFFRPVTALARELRIEKFDSQVTVLQDGTVDVTESITFRFIGHWNGVYREIPVEYNTPQGINYSLFLKVKSITEDGASLKYESSRERHYRKLKIYFPGAEDTTKTIVIEYTVSDALRFFDDHDEFYWNVTGDEWDVPIAAAGATITLPVGATGIRTNVFTGAYRSTGKQAEAEIVGNGVTVHTTAPLGYHEGLTVAVAFDKGLVHEPTAADRTIQFLRSNWPLLLPMGTFCIMFWLWWTKGRDPRLRPIAARYDPPDGLSPSEVGTLIDNSVDMRDITAAIVDLAVRGYLSIEEKDKSSMMGLVHEKDYVFHLKKPYAEWSPLKPHERELMMGIFSEGASAGEAIPLSNLHNQFYRNVPRIKNCVFDALVEHGYYRRRPDSVRTAYIAAGIVVGFLSIWGAMPVAAMLGMAPAPFILAGVLTAAIICIFGWFMPARTISGAQTLEGVLGFEDFLAHVESDRFNRMVKTPEMFEKFLPYAMALGVEKNWSKAFQNIYTQPPSWYQGSYGPGFYPYLFVNNLNSMSSVAGSVMTSAPRSSGGSGFGSGGGGGFSGGGFGGGGGGGF